MAARIHLNDQFSLCPPVVLPIRRHFSSAKPHSTTCEAFLPRPKLDKPPLSIPVLADNKLGVRNNSIPRRPVRPRLQITPRGFNTQETRRTSILSETTSPRKTRVLEANAVINRKPALPPTINAQPTTPRQPANKRDPGLIALSKLRSTRKQSQKMDCFGSKEMRENELIFMPLTDKTEATARVNWTRRMEAREKPLLIMNWEGVLGEWIKPGSGGAYELYMRPNWEKGLKTLLQIFQISLITSLGKSQRNQTLLILQSRGIMFDAVYKKRKTDGTTFILDYSHIINDFAFSTNVKSVLVLSSVGLDQEDLSERQGIDLIREIHASPKIKTGPPPLCILVPNPRAQAGFICTGLDSIANEICQWTLSDGKCSRKTTDFWHIFNTISDKSLTHEVKKLEIGSDLLSHYREELHGLDQSDTRLSTDPDSIARFLVFTKPRNPSKLSNIDAIRPSKFPDRKLERKLSTKSLI